VTSNTLGAVTAGLVAFITSAVATPVVAKAARQWGILDHPNIRSSHRAVTPRAGGLAVLMGVAVALVFASPGTSDDAAARGLLAGTAVIALVGLLDDRFGLSPLVRIAFQVVAASVVVWASGGIARLPLPPPLDLPLGTLAVPVAVLWILAVVNFYNFLDGIDGLAALQAVVTGLGLALAAWDPLAAAAGVAIAGACAAFLIYNWAPASIFLGDVGSATLGFVLAALALRAPTGSRSAAVFLLSISLWFFLADATWTLIARAARGQRVYQAHREHFYQRLAASGWGHAKVTVALGAAAASLTSLAVLSWGSGPHPAVDWGLLGLALVLFGGEVELVRRQEAGSRAGSIINDSRTRRPGGRFSAS
jgi:UDP-N-acetylmuramyl pentapeptide phosphotransferase/UDP-N-acetylglucosamine-1-phosphate transferase